MSKHPPAYQYYPADFEGATRHWTPAEVGCYQRLLNHEWINGPLPTKRLWRIAGATEAEWSEIWKTLSGKFKSTRKGLVNRRLEGVRADQKAYRDRKAAAGRKGGLAKHRSSTATAKPNCSSGKPPSKSLALQSSSSPSSSPSSSKKTRADVPENLNTPTFLTKWSEWTEYRKAKRKPISERAEKAQLKKLSEFGPTVAAQAIDASIANDWQGLFPEKVTTPPKRTDDAASFTTEGVERWNAQP